MDQLKHTIEQLFGTIGFNGLSVEVDRESNKISIILEEGEWLKEWLPRLVPEVHHLVNCIAKRLAVGLVFVDVNNYRKERERLIIELAKAAARKALITKQEIKLPAMNAYERRLIHVELATRPDVTTESVGAGMERGVVVRPI